MSKSPFTKYSSLNLDNAEIVQTRQSQTLSNKHKAVIVCQWQQWIQLIIALLCLFVLALQPESKDSDPGRVHSVYGNKANYALSVYTLLIELGFIKTVLLKHCFRGKQFHFGGKKYTCEEKAQTRDTVGFFCESAMFDQASHVELHTCSAPSGSCTAAVIL